MGNKLPTELFPVAINQLNITLCFCRDTVNMVTVKVECRNAASGKRKIKLVWRSESIIKFCNYILLHVAQLLS